MPPVLLDTHAAIWSADGRFTKAVAKKIEDAAARSELLLSPISAWEIGMLVEKQRLHLAVPVQEYVQKLFSGAGVVTAVLSPAIALAAASLPAAFHGDPADRIIAASAIAYGAELLTRDAVLLRFARQTGALKALHV